MHNMYKFLAVLTLVAPIFLSSMANAYATEDLPTFMAKVGELKKVTFKLINPFNKEQSFAYIIHVTNETGFTDQLSWAEVVLQADQEFRPQQSWIPLIPGKYTVDIFIVECMDCFKSLFPALTMKVNVEP